MNSFDSFDHCWSYFKLHSSQRLTTFNFYIILSTFISGGMVKVLSETSNYNTELGCFLGILLSLISTVFYHIDKRNIFLIKQAELALKNLEISKFQENPNEKHFAIFTNEEKEFKEVRKNKSILIWNNIYSYSECLKAVYLAFSIAGGGGFLLSIFGR